ncbi:unnamed protein product [Lasius platythorax]|uniref:Uncharacterized protein n=1 Tax=Lasius platythorax TaxID=488582 RepID=A0AAV2N888_9HYME
MTFPRSSFVPYGRPVNRCTLWHLSTAENRTMHTPEKLQFPDVSDAPTVPLSQGRARRSHNQSPRYELRMRIPGVAARIKAEARNTS